MCKKHTCNIRLRETCAGQSYMWMTSGGDATFGGLREHVKVRMEIIKSSRHVNASDCVCCKQTRFLCCEKLASCKRHADHVEVISASRCHQFIAKKNKLQLRTLIVSLGVLLTFKKASGCDEGRVACTLAFRYKVSVKIKAYWHRYLTAMLILSRNLRTGHVNILQWR